MAVRRRYLHDWIFYMVAWSVITIFYAFFFITNLRAILILLNLDDAARKDEITTYFISDFQYIEALLFGLLFGSATFVVNLLVDKTTIHKLNYGKIIIIKTILYFVAVMLTFLLISLILKSLQMVPESLGDVLRNGTIPPSIWLATGVFFILSTLQINFLALMNKKFGQGNLLKIFMGKYHRPVVENRLFLFLDLNDSTSIAERLGHVKYSELLQDCFLQLNELLAKAGAEIYQYVGDEAVLTWRNHDRKVVVKPVRLFFDFKKRLEGRAQHFKDRYELVPEFKAGLHGGMVTVAEVGDIKREIAYHGDVVNTASRLRSACSEFGKKFLTSNFFGSKVLAEYGYEVREIGTIHLKGKAADVIVFSIE
jgi:adenylate cyclase